MMLNTAQSLKGVGMLSRLSVQVVGFLILIAGTSMYNELLRGCLPGVPPPVPQHDSLEVHRPCRRFSAVKRLHASMCTASPVKHL